MVITVTMVMMMMSTAGSVGSVLRDRARATRSLNDAISLVRWQSNLAPGMIWVTFDSQLGLMYASWLLRARILLTRFQLWLTKGCSFSPLHIPSPPKSYDSRFPPVAQAKCKNGSLEIYHGYSQYIIGIHLHFSVGQTITWDLLGCMLTFSSWPPPQRVLG